MDPLARTGGELDLRRGRRRQRRAQHGRPRRAREDRPVRDDIARLRAHGDHDRAAPGIDPGRSGRGRRVPVHHRRGRWRLRAHGWVRVGHRRVAGRDDHRDGVHRHPVLGLVHRLALPLPGRDPAGRRPRQQLHPQAGRRSASMSTSEQAATANGTALLEVRNVSKYFGNVVALKDISVGVNAGEVTCVLGDNGAGKSTFIKVLSGVHRHDEGELLVEGAETHFGSPREAKEHGIATVFQDLATVPLMSIWRNFFLGSEPTKSFGPLKYLDVKFAQETMHEELRKMGIDVRDPDQPVGTLSGGERQAVAIARAVYFGAKVLILDEPTSALGVKQSGVVLRYVAQARDRGLGVIFITHNPHHAYPVGDRFVVLNRGRLMGNWKKGEISRDELIKMMSGGAELDALTHELERELDIPPEDLPTPGAAETDRPTPPPAGGRRQRRRRAPRGLAAGRARTSASG